MGVDLTWLKSFLSLARTRNFATAARQNNITQPAFSRRIRALETWVGADLIDRSSYPTTLTPAGERFVQVAEEIDRRLIDTRNEIAELEAGGPDQVVVATQHTLAFTRLPDLFGRLTAAGYASLAIIHSETFHDCVNRIQAGNADLLLVYSPVSVLPDLDALDLTSVLLDEDRLIPVTAPDRAGAPRHWLVAQNPTPVPWLSYGPEAMLEHCVLPVAEHRAANLRPVVRTPISDVLRRFARRGLGVAWLPEHLVAEDLRTRALVPAGDASWAISLPIRAYAPKQTDNPLVASIWSALAG